MCAQNKFSISGGWGYYERVNIGAHWNFSGSSSVSLHGGSSFRFKDNTAYSAGLSFNQTFQKPVFWNLKPGYSMGLLSWTNEDDLYYFKSLSFPFMSHLDYPVSKLISARVEGGVIFNMVTESDRKQNVEAGYPLRLNANMRVKLIYKIGGR